MSGNVRPLKKLRSRGGDDTIVAVLDIGSSKIGCFIAAVIDNGDAEPDTDIIGVGHHGVSLKEGAAPSIASVEKGVRVAVDAAERMAGERIHEVTLSINGRYLRARRIGVDLEIAGGVITAEDIDDSLAEGYKFASAEGYEALHALPISFRVDGEETFADPSGLSGALLSTEMLGVGVRGSALDNFSSLVERCGLKVSGFIASPYAAAESTLIEDEKELGVVLIDIGASSSSYAVYDNGVLVDAGGVGLGGNHITKDIAQIFGAPLAHAERIKTLYGSALMGPGDEHRFIDLPQLGVPGETTRASRADLTEVIAPRLEEIFEMIAAQLPDDAPGRNGLRRAVITGGGSALVGARETAERVLSMKSRLGRPIAISGAPEAASGPGFSVCAGLARHAAKTISGHDSQIGLAGAVQSRYAQKSGVIGGVEAWLRARF